MLPETIKIIAYAKTHTPAITAKAFNVSIYLVYRLRWQNGLTKKHKKLTSYQEAQIWYKRQEGIPHKEIAKEFGISIHRSRDIIVRLNKAEREIDHDPL